MADIVNERVNIAQAELKKRATRLNRIVSRAKGAQKTAAFTQGVTLATQMIEGQSKLLDSAVFETPTTALEQQRNLMLVTGTMNQTVQEGIKYAIDAIDATLNTLEELSR